MEKNIIWKNNSSFMYLEDVIFYFLFSSLKFSIQPEKFFYTKPLRPLTVFGQWISNKTLSKNNLIFIFFQTTEELCKFLKFSTEFTDKIEIIQPSQKAGYNLKTGFLFVLLKNNINKIRIINRYGNKLFKFSDIFCIDDFPGVNSFLLEINGIKSNLSFFSNFRNINQDLTRSFFYKENELLKLKLTKISKKACFFLNCIRFLPIHSLDSFFKFLNNLLKTSYSKILFINNDSQMLKGYLKYINVTISSSITKNTPIYRTIRNLKKFNSTKKGLLIINSEIWKEKNLFNRIDFRNLTIAFKVASNLKKNNSLSVKSFLYF